MTIATERPRRYRCPRCRRQLRVYRYSATWPGDDAGKPYTEPVQRRLHDIHDCTIVPEVTR